MKTRTKWLIGAAVLTLAVGGYAMKELVFGFGDEVFVKKPTREEKQLAYLKEHEQEIIDFVKAQNPKIESVQIDWDSMEVVELNAGLAKNPGYNLSLKGMFNNLANTEFTVDFYIENSSDIPIISKIGMLNNPSILKDGVWIDYE